MFGVVLHRQWLDFYRKFKESPMGYWTGHWMGGTGSHIESLPEERIRGLDSSPCLRYLRFALDTESEGR